MMMAVSFERYGRLYYLDPGAHSPAIGDKVLVPTDSGPEVAECVWAPQWVSEEIDGLPVCEGIATEDDLARDEVNRRRRAAVRLAKDQELPVNPLRIAGACGRLMCCLKYEHPLYQDFRKDAPPVGTAVTTPAGDGTVIGHNVPSDTVVVKLAADGRAAACPKASVCGSRKAYESMHGKAAREEG